MTGIQKQTATVYLGGGRRYFSKRAAYNAAAIALVKSKCACTKTRCMDDPLGCNCVETCAYCSNEYKDAPGYRNHLTKRLARWLKWRDERAGR